MKMKPFDIENDAMSDEESLHSRKDMHPEDEKCLPVGEGEHRKRKRSIE